MIRQDLLHEPDPCFDQDIGESDQPSMAFSFEIKELAEIFVDRDEDAVLCGGLLQKRFVSRIFFQLPRVQNLMALFPEPLGKPPASAPIDEESQRLATRTASRDSSATIA